MRTNLTYNGTGDGDASGVFRPQQIDAQVGDQLLFNFTRGNHSVIQSTFDQPCVPISEHNTTVNGFNTGYRDTNNGTAITDFLVDITPEWENQTIWFYDGNTCGEYFCGRVQCRTVRADMLRVLCRHWQVAQTLIKFECAQLT